MGKFPANGGFEEEDDVGEKASYSGPPPPYTAAPQMTQIPAAPLQQRQRSPPYYLLSYPDLKFYFNTGAGGQTAKPPKIAYNACAYAKTKLKQPQDACTIQLHEERITAYLELSDKSTHLASLHRAYALISIQLLITAGVVALFITQEGLKNFTQRHALHVHLTFLATLVVVLCPCCGYGSRSPTANLVCLGALALAAGLAFAEISSGFRIDDVEFSAGVAIVIFVGLTIYASHSRLDFDRLSRILYVIWVVSVISLFVVELFRGQLSINPKVAYRIFVGITVLIFSCWLVCHTQLILGSRRAHQASPEHYNPTTIYLDVIFMWLNLLFFADSFAH